MTDSSSSSPPSTGAASSSSQAGKGRPSRISKRRENKLAYHGIARYFDNHHAFPATATSSSRPGPDPHLSRFPVQIHQSSLSSSPTNDLGYANFFPFQDAIGNEIAAFEQHNHHGLPNASFPPSSLGSYTFHSIPPNSSLPPQSTPVSPLAGGPSQVSGNGFQCAPYTGAMDMFPSDGDGISAPGSRMGSFDSLDSFNSMALSLGTQASSVTEGFVCPVTDSSFGSPRMDVINDLQLPGEYFQAGQNLDLNSSYDPAQMASPQLNDAFPLDNEFMSAGWGAGNNIYEIGGGQWPSASLTHQQLMGNMEPLIPTELSQSPWSVERMPPNQTADPACVTFESPPGIPFKILKAREEVLESKIPFCPDPPVSPMDDDGWEDIYMNAASSYAGSSTVHDSPRSEGQSWLQIDSSPFNSPSPVQIASQHIFTATNITGSASPKSRGGRTRALTPQEKQETLDVRKAKACWACHLSKIKCSPCSQGVSCQQCERLKGKRRFCLLTCFNDPLESLEAFVLPKYLTGHITQANVEQAVSQHGTSWGKQEILIRMGWGYEKPLEARVVALILPSQSQLGYQHQAVGSNFKRPELVRKKSPPLGIPLASFEDMKVEYRNMVRDIVMGDLESYVEVPYDNQESELPEHLLGIICTFYRAGLAAGQECELLREVIAIHVISTILERSLILDDDSLRRVEKHLNDSFPRPSAANCVQRQIKFALFLAQRERVSQVLEDWGHMMWSSSKGMNVEQKWATSFSVLVMLILVVDKMIEAADLFCRGEVQHHGADALAERRAFEELVRLTQRELFERCKEIFHSSFKTRKGGKEACNPIRDGLSAFRGRPVPEGISRLVWDLKNAHRVYGPEIRSQWTTRASIEGAEYGNAGRLASVFLGDFVSE